MDHKHLPSNDYNRMDHVLKYALRLSIYLWDKIFNNVNKTYQYERRPVGGYRHDNPVPVHIDGIHMDQHTMN